MKLIYIAGPYRGKTPADVQVNINKAWECGASLIKQIGDKGFFPIIPHLNTMHMDGLQSDEYFLDGTAGMMVACDGVLLTGDWEKSKGTMDEISIAHAWEIPVFHSIGIIAEYDWKDITNENKNDQA